MIHSNLFKHSIFLVCSILLSEPGYCQSEREVYNEMKQEFLFGKQRCYTLEYITFGPSESTPIEKMKAHYRSEDEGERVLFQVEDQVTLLSLEGVLQIDNEEKVMLYSTRQLSNPFFALLDTLIQSSINIKMSNTPDGKMILSYLFDENSNMCKNLLFQLSSEGHLLQIDIFYPNTSIEANAFQNFTHLRILIQEDLTCSRFTSRDLYLSTYLKVTNQGPVPTQEFADYELLSL